LAKLRTLKILVLGTASTLVAAAALSGSVSASPQPSPDAQAGSLRVDMFGWPGDTDPAIAQTTTAQQFQYASCAKLVNYPDPPSPDQSRLMPEIAEAMPTVSPDGLTYTTTPSHRPRMESSPRRA